MMNTKINLNDKEQNNQIELTSEENIQISGPNLTRKFYSERPEQ